MFRVLWMKESVKLRFPLLGLCLFHLALCGLLFFEVRRLFSLEHAETVWYNLVMLKQIPYRSFRYAGVLTGVLLACFQFAPETAGGKLRLSLHLPCPTWAMVFCHLGAGLLALVLPFAIDFAGLTVVMSCWFPRQVVWDSWGTTGLWLMAGCCAYCALAGAFLEPRRPFKLWYVLLGAGTAGLLTRRFNPGSAWALLGWGAVFALLLALGALHAAYRFRTRRVA